MKEAIKAIILPAVIGILGIYFTQSYDSAKLRVDYANAVHQYLPYIQSENIVEAQMAMEILRPILTPEQEEVISRIIEAKQKMAVEMAGTNGDDLLSQINDVVKLDMERGNDLNRYAQAVALRYEGIDSLVSGNYEAAAENLSAAGAIHTDFEPSSKFAELIEDNLLIEGLREAREIEILNSISSSSSKLPIPEKQKLDQRLNNLRKKSVKASRKPEEM